ncbi:POK9 protein, partial [Halcyon senegalensis]|nr:POK9 protein [Halcyon senegalensis]
SGSAGVDVETEIEITLSDTLVQCIPTTVFGPLRYGISALLIVRSSATKKGVFVLPGVIDSDFSGQIKIMVWTLSPSVNILAKTKIAQLVPFRAQTKNSEALERGEEGFGSTGKPQVYLSLDIGRQKPMVKIKFFSAKEERGRSSIRDMLVDTGADVTIFS